MNFTPRQPTSGIKQSNHQQGFTLIEVLLAVAIFAMISLASFSVFNGVSQSQIGAEEKLNRLNEIQRAWLVIERDLLQISRRSARIEGEAPLQQFIYAETGNFIDNEQALAFVRDGWSNPGLLIPRSDMQSVAYRIEDNTLERLHYNFVDPVVGEEPKIRPLISNVEGMKMRFFINKKWQDRLESKDLPQAIELTIQTKDLADLTRKFLLVEAISQSKRTESSNGGSSGNANNNGSGNNNNDAGNNQGNNSNEDEQ